MRSFYCKISATGLCTLRFCPFLVTINNWSQLSTFPYFIIYLITLLAHSLFTRKFTWFDPIAGINLVMGFQADFCIWNVCIRKNTAKSSVLNTLPFLTRERERGMGYNNVVSMNTPCWTMISMDLGVFVIMYWLSQCVHHHCHMQTVCHCLVFFLPVTIVSWPLPLYISLPVCHYFLFSISLPVYHYFLLCTSLPVYHYFSLHLVLERLTFH